MAVIPVLFDGAGSAKVAGLRSVDDRTTPGIRRVGRRPPFRYLDSSSRPVRNALEPDEIAVVRLLEEHEGRLQRKSA